MIRSRLFRSAHFFLFACACACRGGTTSLFDHLTRGSHNVCEVQQPAQLARTANRRLASTGGLEARSFLGPGPSRLELLGGGRADHFG